MLRLINPESGGLIGRMGGGALADAEDDATAELKLAERQWIHGEQISGRVTVTSVELPGFGDEEDE